MFLWKLVLATQSSQCYTSSSLVESFLERRLAKCQCKQDAAERLRVLDSRGLLEEYPNVNFLINHTFAGNIKQLWSTIETRVSIKTVQTGTNIVQ